MPITITEGLAEIKTIGKRIEKKRDFVRQYLARQDGIKDPLEKDGGSFAAIARERQAINDLEDRIVKLRRGIQTANEATIVAVNGTTRSIADWLVWRREAAPLRQNFLAQIRQHLNEVREKAKRSGSAIIQATAVADKPTDVIVNINEQELATEIETLEETLGTLDGIFSLKNATVMIIEE